MDDRVSEMGSKLFGRIILSCPQTISNINPVMKKIQITLELNEKIVKKIEKLTGDKFKDLIEKEINESGEVFIEMMGYDNI